MRVSTIKQNLEALSDTKDLNERLLNLSKEELSKVIIAIKMLSLVEKQHVPCDTDLHSIGLIQDLYSKYGSSWTAIMAFSYGRIQGIRQERRKRKKLK